MSPGPTHRRAEPTATSARQFLPERRDDPAALREAARRCRGCGLYARATQTVFGAGPRRARLMLVGEQPGHDEDLAGEPFVGPAGRLLDRALIDAGIDRAAVYVTNAVKHFKWEPRGKRRLHAKPGAREIAACLPWLEAEIEAVQPQLLVCLGATAAQALLGRGFRVSVDRGRSLTSSLGVPALATVHPSAILRSPSDEDRARAMAGLVADLKRAAKLLP